MSWIGARPRLVVASVVVLVLVATALVWVSVSRAPDGTERAVDCSIDATEQFSEASTLAVACRKDVEVTGERTPWNTTYATGDGSTRLEVSAAPTRVQSEGEWVEPSNSLVASDGVIATEASVYPIELNPGGRAGVETPLGTITRDGQSISVWFPLDLPAPSIEGSRATYDLEHGITVHVSVNSDGTGFLPVIELEDAAAAARLGDLLAAASDDDDPAVGPLDLAFRVEALEGLSLVPDDQGAVHVVDDEDETHFMATVPVMWDSSGPMVAPSAGSQVSATDRAAMPSGGDRVEQMDLTVVDDTVVVTPVEAMLADPDTVWPVFIDPSFSGEGPNEWVAVRSGGFSSTVRNWGDLSSTQEGQGVGLCSTAVTSSCNSTYTQRLAWEYSGLTVLDDLTEADIVSAQFRVDGVHSFNCTAQKTTLYRTSNLSTGTKWSNLTWSTPSVGSRTEAHSSTCGGSGFKEFNATAAVEWAADNDQTTISLGLRVDESAMSFWKRFRHNATLAFTYNRAPLAPEWPRLNDQAGCVTGSGRPVLSETNPQISSVLKDPDGEGIRGSFVVALASDHENVKWNSGNLSEVAHGARKTAQVPTGNLQTNTTYAWRSRGWDESRYGAWSSWCEFRIDTTKPGMPTVTPVTSGVAAVYLADAERGGKGQAGAFQFNRGSSSDVVSFSYRFDYAAFQSVTPDSSGKATVSYTPLTTGPHTLLVRSVDSANNVSSYRTYEFIVATATEDGIWKLDEGKGLSAAVTAGSPAGPMDLVGPSWVRGPHELFDSRDGDWALKFDGVNDYAIASGPVVDTTTSFTISAHVLLDPAKIGSGQTYTALSQDGVATSGFGLEYRSSCAAQSSGCWAFTMPNAISGSTATTLVSPEPVTGGEWTHLVAEYNKDTSSMKMWVCEIGTPEDPGLGDPKSVSIPRTATPWAASGAFALGRGLSSAAGTSFWPGSIDNVRVFSGEVLAESKIRRLCQGAEASDFGGSAAIDPTVKSP